MAKTQKVIPVTIYVTPEQKMMLDMISKQKRSNVSNLLRSVLDAYLKYMDKAFLHPGEQDVMARLQKLEDPGQAQPKRSSRYRAHPVHGRGCLENGTQSRASHD